MLLFILFFFNDTATTEIYTYCTLFPYTTLFRSGRARAVEAGAGDREALPASDGHRVGEGRRQRQAVHRCRSEEHTSELQSLMRISYAVFCLKKKKKNTEI